MLASMEPIVSRSLVRQTVKTEGTFVSRLQTCWKRAARPSTQIDPTLSCGRPSEAAVLFLNFGSSRQILLFVGIFADWLACVGL